MNILKMILPIGIACFFNAVANAFWKAEFIKNPLEISSFSKAIGVFFSLNIIIGICFYVASMVIFFYLLSNFNLSIIVPLTSLTYIFNLISAHFIFKENISFNALLGTFIIIIGIVVLSQGAMGDKV